MDKKDLEKIKKIIGDRKDAHNPEASWIGKVVVLDTDIHRSDQ